MNELNGPIATCPRCGWHGRQFSAFCPSCPGMVKFDHLDPPVSTPPATPEALRARARPTPSKLPQQATGAGSAIGIATMAAGAAWAIEDPTTRAVMTLLVAVVIYAMGRFATVFRTK
jgi:hypothetical protein